MFKKSYRTENHSNFSCLINTHTHTELLQWMKWSLIHPFLLWIITFSLSRLALFLSSLRLSSPPSPPSHQALQQLGVLQSSLPHRPLGRAQSSPAATVNPIKHLFTTGQSLSLFFFFSACVYPVCDWMRGFYVSGVSPPSVCHHVSCLATRRWLLADGCDSDELIEIPSCSIFFILFLVL